MVTTITSLLTWSRYFYSRHLTPQRPEILEHTFSVRPELNDKVSLWQGDITKLDADAIVNAARPSLLGGGGVDGAIHSAAGNQLVEECATLNGCQVGEAKMTKGYNLPSKHVIHTVGPMTQNREELEKCYQNSFALMLQRSLRSIAFPCISTGVYGYDQEQAAHVAIYETRMFLADHHDKVDRVVFCVFENEDFKIYEELLQRYFPVVESAEAVCSKEDVEKMMAEAPPQKKEHYAALLKDGKPKEMSFPEVMSKV